MFNGLQRSVVKSYSGNLQLLYDFVARSDRVEDMS